jgi:ubiquinone/menaquinone biosynthesis C-methylase UbiE
MASTHDSLAPEERLVRVLRHLGIERVHLAARVPGDWQGLVSTHPECVASLTLVCPPGMNPQTLRTLASRLLVISGEQGQPAENAGRVVASLPGAALAVLPGYDSPSPYTDLGVERGDDIGTAMLDFLARMERDAAVAEAGLPEAQGEAAGLTYRVLGSGPPLVLLPLSVAPSQWQPFLPRLAAEYCVIVLTGPALGMVASLEARGHTAGYLRVLGNVMDAVDLQPGETVLEVGCGTGVLDRWLARRTNRQNRIIGVDINPFLLREALALARQEGLEEVIEFREGSAEALPLPDNSVDISLSSTVIQRVDADRMLAEMVRVTRPGGRVAMVGHAHDIPRWVNLPLRADLKARIEAPGWDGMSIHPGGCDEASLYPRMHAAGLTHIKKFPQFAAFDDPARLQTLQASILPTLSPDEADEWRVAVARVEAAGTFFIATPLHCAVGTKP